MTADPRLSEYDALSTEELRHRAFDLAGGRHDVRFLWGLFKHLPHSPDTEAIDGSTGSFGLTVDDAVALWKEWTGHQYGSHEPLVRAAFIDYLMEHDRP
ncbi:MAG: hypothetical protein ABJA34_04125 [Pseudonocardiales bacterium]